MEMGAYDFVPQETETRRVARLQHRSMYGAWLFSRSKDIDLTSRVFKKLYITYQSQNIISTVDDQETRMMLGSVVFVRAKLYLNMFNLPLQACPLFSFWSCFVKSHI